MQNNWVGTPFTSFLNLENRFNNNLRHKQTYQPTMPIRQVSSSLNFPTNGIFDSSLRRKIKEMNSRHNSSNNSSNALFDNNITDRDGYSKQLKSSLPLSLTERLLQQIQQNQRNFSESIQQMQKNASAQQTKPKKKKRKTKKTSSKRRIDAIFKARNDQILNVYTSNNQVPSFDDESKQSALLSDSSKSANNCLLTNKTRSLPLWNAAITTTSPKKQQQPKSSCALKKVQAPTETYKIKPVSLHSERHRSCSLKNISPTRSQFIDKQIVDNKPQQAKRKPTLLATSPPQFHQFTKQLPSPISCSTNIGSSQSNGFSLTHSLKHSLISSGNSLAFGDLYRSTPLAKRSHANNPIKLSTLVWNSVSHPDLHVNNIGSSVSSSSTSILRQTNSRPVLLEYDYRSGIRGRNGYLNQENPAIINSDFISWRQRKSSEGSQVEFLEELQDLLGFGDLMIPLLKKQKPYQQSAILHQCTVPKSALNLESAPSKTSHNVEEPIIKCNNTWQSSGKEQDPINQITVAVPLVTNNNTLDKKRNNPHRRPSTRIFSINSQDSFIRRALIKQGWQEQIKGYPTRFDLKWVYTDTSEDYRQLEPHQYYNHFRNSSEMTAKGRLAVNLKQYLGEQTIDAFFPKCYDIGNTHDRSAFARDFNRRNLFILLRNLVKYFKLRRVKAMESVKRDHQYKSLLNRKYNRKTNKVISKHNPLELEEPVTDLFFLSNSVLLVNVIFVLRQLKYSDTRILPEEDGSPFSLFWRQVDSYARIAGPYDEELGLFNRIPQMTKEFWSTPSLYLMRKVYSLHRYFKKANNPIAQGTRNIWIIKPSANSRGQGISLVDRMEDAIESGLKMQARIVQKYIERPLIFIGEQYKQLNGHKFDIRQWVLVTCVKPLKIYYFNANYLRVCASTYDITSIKDVSRHLTNYSLNKQHIQAGVGTAAESMTVVEQQEFIEYLREFKSVEYDAVLKPKIQKIVIDTVKCMAHKMESRGNSFELFGFDLLVDEAVNPWLIEVNMSPACAERTPGLVKMLDAMASQMFEIIFKSDGVSKQQDDNHQTTMKWEVLFDERENSRCSNQAILPHEQQNQLFNNDGTEKNNDTRLDCQATEQTVIGEWISRIRRRMIRRMLLNWKSRLADRRKVVTACIRIQYQMRKHMRRVKAIAQKKAEEAVTRIASVYRMRKSRAHLHVLRLAYLRKKLISTLTAAVYFSVKKRLLAVIASQGRKFFLAKVVAKVVTNAMMRRGLFAIAGPELVRIRDFRVKQIEEARVKRILLSRLLEKKLHGVVQQVLRVWGSLKAMIYERDYPPMLPMYFPKSRNERAFLGLVSQDKPQADRYDNQIHTLKRDLSVPKTGRIIDVQTQSQQTLKLIPKPLGVQSMKDNTIAIAKSEIEQKQQTRSNSNYFSAASAGSKPPWNIKQQR